MAHDHGYDVHVRRSITIGRKADELYTVWHSPERLAGFTAGCESVHEIDSRRSLWRVRIPGMGLESWESEIVEDMENELIAWKTVGETRFDHEGRVTFAATRDGAGTVVTLEIDTRMPGGTVSNAIGKIFGQSPEDYVSNTLHNFKQLMETGEIASNRGPMGKARVFTGVGPKVALAGGAMLTLFGALMYSRRAGGEA